MAQVELPPGVPDFESFLAERRAETVKNKEKKRGGIPWWPSAASTKGLGVGAQLAATLGSKIGITIVCAALSAAGAGLGMHQKGLLQQQQADMKKKQFQTSLLREHMLKRNQALKTSVPTVDKARNDTVGFVYGGGLAGPNPADGSAAAAGAAGAAGAGDGSGAGDGKGAKNEAEVAAPDANAMAADMMKQMAGAQGADGAAAGARGGNFGKLSAGMGGGMRGGGGMSGGVGRGFDQVAMKNSMLAKAQGMRGGNEASLKDNKMRDGKARKWEARGGKTSRARGSASANRLRSMASDMAANRNGDVAKSATANTAAWEATAAPSQIATGAGASIGGPSGASGAGIGTMPGETQEGGPVNMGPDLPGSDLGTQVPEIPDYVNATPYQGMIDMAKMLMILAMVLTAFVVIAKYLIKGFFTTTAGIALLGYCMTALAIVGGLLAAIGVYLLAMDQVVQGAIYTIIGGAIAVTALITPEATGAIVTQFAVAAGAPAVGLLAAGAANDADVSDFREQEKTNYKKKYGVDPDKNKEIINREKFDQRHGEGASDKYDENRQFDDMR